MKIAVEGCCHGELDKIYESVAFLEKENNMKVDLLIICGDFQAVRNYSDLQCMAVPPKYRKLNTFYKYYSGELVAPVLTLFIGGNHEASNYLSELFYGGWVCPNIYYMGRAGVVNVGGIRIAGLSGIYKGADYLKGHYEIPPYNQSTVRSTYHVRNLEVFRLKQMKQPVDIFVSHDWPRGVYNYGDVDQLLKRKPFFRDEVCQNKLGSRPAEELLYRLKPKYWFAAHLHCKFAALVPHVPSESPNTSYTKFLALDKCLPRRNFLQILDLGGIASESPPLLEYDAEWLCILRSTNHLLNLSATSSYMPGPGCTDRWDFSPSDEEMTQVQRIFNNNFKIPANSFVPTAPCIAERDGKDEILLAPLVNPQTTSFCKKLAVTDPTKLLVDSLSSTSTPQKDRAKSFAFVDEDEEDVTSVSQPSLNPDEIHLESSDESEDKASADFGGSDGGASNRSGNEFESSRVALLTRSADLRAESEDDDVGSCFVIDRKGNRSANFCAAGSEHLNLASVNFCSSPSPSGSNYRGNGAKRVAAHGSCVKTMKRRNQMLYQSADVSSEED